MIKFFMFLFSFLFSLNFIKTRDDLLLINQESLASLIETPNFDDNFNINFHRENNKYYFSIPTRMYQGHNYVPYRFENNNGYYILGDNLSEMVEITKDNYNLNYNFVYVYFDTNYRFDNTLFTSRSTPRINNKKSKPEDPFDIRKKTYEWYYFEYNTQDLFYCLNRNNIYMEYYKRIHILYNSGQEEVTEYSFESQKEEFIEYIEKEISNSLFYKSKDYSFIVGDYISLDVYGNNIVSSYQYIPKKNIVSWYQSSIPNLDNEKESVYSSYAFLNYDQVNNLLISRYQQIVFNNNNSSFSTTNYTNDGYIEELTYCNKKYSNIKIYDGYLSKDSHIKDEFFLLRIPGTTSNPIAILKEWVPVNVTYENYINEIVKYYIKQNNVIVRCDYSTPLRDRVKEYEEGSIYDREDIFVDSFSLKSMKRQECNIDFNYLSIQHKVVNASGTYIVSTKNISNETNDSFDKPGFYKVIETNLNGTTLLPNIIIPDKKKDELKFYVENDSIIEEQLLSSNKNIVYLKLNQGEEKTLVFPHNDSIYVKIEKDDNIYEIHNFIDYNNLEQYASISYPTFKVVDQGKYKINISNRFGYSYTYILNISKQGIDYNVIDVSNKKISIEINTSDIGLNSVSSYFIKRCFYPKENSTSYFDEIIQSNNYDFEDVTNSSSYVSFSKSNSKSFLNNVFTFYPKIEDNNTYYQVIRIYIKDYYGNILDKIIKWNYVLEEKLDFSLVLDALDIEVNSAIKYKFNTNNNYQIKEDDYLVEIIEGANNILIDKSKQIIVGLNEGKSIIKFVFVDDLNVKENEKLFILNILSQNNNVNNKDDNAEENNEIVANHNSNLNVKKNKFTSINIIPIIIVVGILLLGSLIFCIIKKKKTGNKKYEVKD